MTEAPAPGGGRTPPPGSPLCSRPARIGAAELGGERVVIAVATTADTIDGTSGAGGTGGSGSALAQALAAAAGGADLVELRLDLLSPPRAASPQDQAAFWHEAILLVAAALAPTGTPLLATVRSRREGGGAAMDPREQAEALEALIDLQAEHRAGRAIADALDIELSTGALPALTERAHQEGIAVVASNHDFTATPPDGEMLDRLERMEAGGADCAKIAVMPRSEEDVDRALQVAARARASLSIPVAVISMGERGRRSRLEGWRYGSALTFATLSADPAAASAPGQPTIAALLPLSHRDRSKTRAKPGGFPQTDGC
ncbi:type I 3-dehydroquinate dehydratase [Actinomyces sp. zg296]|uniref:type I 3-dehydroquinate dehydratase n=1 Tax=Actinomyces sp. zg296 TaxID=2609289 RepID=UPI001359A5E2|nr:type I 3-dehydroquinate dehydratase [Actinomyces sp. zg296]